MISDKNKTYDKSIITKIALLEKERDYTNHLLIRIEEKIDKLDLKIEKVESRIYSNFKWFLGISLTGIISIAGLGLSIYQYVKH